VAQTFFSSCDDVTAHPVCWTVHRALGVNALEVRVRNRVASASTSKSGSIDRIDRRIGETLDHSWFIGSTPFFG
jgi:hypothetical protein